MAEVVLDQMFMSVLLITLAIAVQVSATHPGQLRLGARRDLNSIESPLSSEYVVNYYTQTLDHFNYNPESYETFQQRHVLNFKYWGGANNSSPIFVYLGAESSVVGDIPGVKFIDDLAARFNGLLLYMEHRYYGESIPFGSKYGTQNASARGYFSSTQALADYAELIRAVKKNLSAEHSPVIAIGASYGGMLASWLRLKYPHIVLGALASSAPILYFDDITPHDGYFVVVTKDFKDTSESCYNTIKQSWSEIDRVAALPNGLAILSQKFNTCSPLSSTQELKDPLSLMYMASAQYDNPPEYYVEKICNAIDGAPKDTDIIGRIAAGIKGSSFYKIIGDVSCTPVFDTKPSNKSSWTWQTCTEMVIPAGIDEDDNKTMFEPDPFEINNYTKTCVDLFGVAPRPHWVTTEFGGKDIKSVLKKFGSNIIFSNGLRDPYSSGGALEDLSDSLVAIYTEKGAHCLDMHTPTSNDPDWLVDQRQKEIKIINLWLAEYYTKLFQV